MEFCIKCKAMPATVFVMRKIEDGSFRREGYCINCAKSIGVDLPPEVMDASSLLSHLAQEMENIISQEGEGADLEGTILNNPNLLEFMKNRQPQNSKNDGKGEKTGKEQKKNAGRTQPPPPPFAQKSYIEQFCIDLTEQAQKGALDPVIGRERELDRLMQILLRRQKNNPCLIGEPGVGKTAIAEALAQRIYNKNAPYKLLNKRVMLLDMTAVVAGTQYRGQFEARMKALINEIKVRKNIILVIDEVHTIVSAGSAEGTMNAANILKPALSRGEIQIIGATTLAEYRKFIEKDAALERRFQPITVDEPSLDATLQILRGIKTYYEEFHHIKVPASLLPVAVRLSERYITDRFLPDKAIDLLDEACSRLALHSKVLDEYKAAEARLSELAEIEEKLAEDIEKLEGDERDALYESLANIKTEKLELEKCFAELTKKADKIRLSEEDIAKVIEIWTGVPASSITEHEFDKLARLDETLKTHIVGQDKAISAITKAIKRSRVGVSAKQKPISFIFAGPTGVGKTELVKRLANELFDSPESLIRLDMSEFMEKHSVSRIIGSPPGYVGYEEAGQLTEKIRRKPYSVVLFDEIEKAHPDVLNILLQILDDGRITDAQGRTVNFESAVIVMTTNAGSQYLGGSLGFGESKASQAEARTEQALSDFLRPEFLNRVDEVITFNHLSREDFKKISVILLNELAAAMKQHGYTVNIDDAAVAAVAENSYSEKFGARNMRRYIQSTIEDAVAEQIIDSRSTAQTVTVTAADGKISVNVG